MLHNPRCQWETVLVEYNPNASPWVCAKWQSWPRAQHNVEQKGIPGDQGKSPRWAREGCLGFRFCSFSQLLLAKAACPWYSQIGTNAFIKSLLDARSCVSHFLCIISLRFYNNFQVDTIANSFKAKYYLVSTICAYLESSGLRKIRMWVFAQVESILQKHTEYYKKLDTHAEMNNQAIEMRTLIRQALFFF